MKPKLKHFPRPGKFWKVKFLKIAMEKIWIFVRENSKIFLNEYNVVYVFNGICVFFIVPFESLPF